MLNLSNYRNMITALQEISASAHIAGGAVRDTILERPIRDVDIFLADEAREAAAKLLRAKFGYVKVGEWQQYEHFSEPSITQVAKFERADCEIPVCLIGLNEQMFSCGISMQSNIERFDFGICMAAYNGREQITNEAFKDDVQNRTFTLLRADNDAQFTYSMVRYKKLTKERYAGWQLIVPVMFEPLVAKHELSRSWYRDDFEEIGWAFQGAAAQGTRRCVG
jgi:hypothetical protein